MLIDEFYNSEEENEENEVPIFDLISQSYKPSGNIKMIASSNRIIVMGLEDNLILRYDQSKELNIETFRFTKIENESIIENLFLDPSGLHLIISCTNGQNYYHYYSQKKQPKLSNKLKTEKITAVAWDPVPNKSAQTDSILVGTSLGEIIEIKINSKVSYKESRFQFKEKKPITGIHYNRFPPYRDFFYVLVTTAEEMNQFIGGPDLKTLFLSYGKKKLTTSNQFVENGSTFSKLSIFNTQKKKTFAWFTSVTIYFGELNFTGKNPKDEDLQIVEEAKVLPYPLKLNSNPKQNSRSKSLFPQDMILTEFHFLFIYPTDLSVVSTLDGKPWEEKKSKGTSNMIGITQDPETKKIIVYSKKDLYKVDVFEEDRNIWLIYLKRGDFEQALMSSKNKEQKDHINQLRALHLYKNGHYHQSASVYAKTTLPFEEIALKFLSITDPDPLQIYLVNKVDTIKETDPTQASLITTWLVEVYLQNINDLEAQLKKKKQIPLELKEDELMNYHIDQKRIKELENKLKNAIENFKNFLSDNKQVLDQETTYSRIISHGRIPELLFFAEATEDYKTVVKHHIRLGNYGAALDLLVRQKEMELIYIYSPLLMFNSPVETVQTWIKLKKRLLPQRLLPAIMRYSPSRNPKGIKQNQAIRYLEYCINILGNQDRSIHHYLLSLYAQMENDHDLRRLLRSEGLVKVYDQKYALRLCKKFKQDRACVYLYGEMELYEQAVELALKIDLNLAQEKADMPDDETLRKQLWLRIAKHVVEQVEDVPRAIEFLKQTDLITVDDILPFFPENIKINDFSTHIKSSLDTYTKEINDLKEEMKRATDRAFKIRQDVQELPQRSYTLYSNQTCNLCRKPLQFTEFYVFHCEHSFHKDCLKEHMIQNYLSNFQIKSINNIEEKILLLQENIKLGITENKHNTKAEEEILSLKKKLRKKIAFDCVICGEIVLKLIHRPFVHKVNEKVLDSWKI
ncbi:vacuolar protein sorting-associated protein [Anaeramoeba flamelloides]|uniref:Vacuolar protein sorting-associated protein n=1 Tax=Anaeramoeba flamelloides TaxID=1746091 RepID=A0ABQ8YKJ1_9EUKA|nr:vacuolar protein sorting-associated protein [Anaeramoeba flamelloides]